MHSLSEMSNREVSVFCLLLVQFLFLVAHTCADPESFDKGGANLTSFVLFDKGRERIKMPSKVCHL